MQCHLKDILPKQYYCAVSYSYKVMFLKAALLCCIICLKYELSHYSMISPCSHILTTFGYIVYNLAVDAELVNNISRHTRQLLFETLFILRRIQLDTINVHKPSHKVPVTLVRF